MFRRKREIKNVPVHIAFIMDGNRRWATKRGFNKTFGHKQGGIALKNIINTLCEIEGIKYASFFAFSTENWSRDKKEIDYILEVAYNLVLENRENFCKKNIKFVVMGDISVFSDKLKNILIDIMHETQNNTGLVVNLALNYGGRDDIIHAVNKLIQSGEKEITVEKLNKNLYSYPSPDIDLLIRTSGEMRVSNFMLFQMAYSELYFTKTCWPDFDKKELMKAIKDYSTRHRKFGGQ